MGLLRSDCAFVILHVLCGFLLLGSFGAELQAQSSAENGWRVQWEPQELVNGSAVLFRVSAPETLSGLEGKWFDRQLVFRFGHDCNCWFALAAVDLNAKPGKYPLRLEGKTQAASVTKFSHEVSVSEKHYPTSTITVPPKYIKPPPEVLSRIAEEGALKKQVFEQSPPQSIWSGQFAAPVTTGITAVFGSARLYNGEKQGVHQGLDFRAALGTPVHATNEGKVAIARNLYYEGNCVMIDHGDGLFTIYMHLSEIKVHEGAKVQTGELLGLSGNTGRVTGPHLHFATRWQGLYLDPETLLRLHPPSP